MIEIDGTVLRAHRREMEKFEAIRESVAACNVRVARESPYPNIPEMLAELHGKHGKRRVAMFFANVVNGSHMDGRYSDETREWAERQPPIPQNPHCVNYPYRIRKPPGEFGTDMHPTVVDGFAKHIIRNQRETRAKRRDGPDR